MTNDGEKQQACYTVMEFGVLDKPSKYEWRSRSRLMLGLAPRLGRAHKNCKRCWAEHYSTSWRTHFTVNKDGFSFQMETDILGLDSQFILISVCSSFAISEKLFCLIKSELEIYFAYRITRFRNSCSKKMGWALVLLAVLKRHTCSLNPNVARCWRDPWSHGHVHFSFFFDDLEMCTWALKIWGFNPQL